MKRKSILVMIAICFTGFERAESTQILSGSSLPWEQGWGTYTQIANPLDVHTDGTNLRVNTWGSAPSPPTSYTSGPFLLFNYQFATLPSGYTVDFTVDVELQVHSSTYNYCDGSVVLMGTFQFLAVRRKTMVVFGEDRITWGDLSDTYLIDTTDDFHSYRLSIGEFGTKAYVDGILALERGGYSPNGIIAFGDQTNDLGLDGDFSVRSIDISDVSLRELPIPIPAPSAILLTTIGVGFVGWLRRRRTL